MKMYVSSAASLGGLPEKSCANVGLPFCF